MGGIVFAVFATFDALVDSSDDGEINNTRGLGMAFAMSELGGALGNLVISVPKGDDQSANQPVLPALHMTQMYIKNAKFWISKQADEYTLDRADTFIYHRRESAETLAIRLEEYEKSRLLSGGTRNIIKDGAASIDAYFGPLPEGQTGFEFNSAVPSSSMQRFAGDPGVVWNEGQPGVVDLSNGMVGVYNAIEKIQLAE